MVYLISGLGADERMFTRLNLGEEVDFKHIAWEKADPKESFVSYCHKLLNQIDRDKPIVLIGMSFGGIVAQMISTLVKVEKIIIISSVKSPNEFGRQLALVRATKIYSIIPKWLLKWSNLLTGDYFFSTKSKEESLLLRSIIKDTDQDFLKWCIHQIMHWKGTTPNCDLIHIHGDEDRIFSPENIKNCLWVKGGGHLMIHNKGEEVSGLVRKSL